METTDIRQDMENTAQQGQEAQQQAQQQEQQEKTFTQKEMNRLIEKRIERERKKYPNAEELEQFKQWQQNQQTEQQKWSTLQKERNDFENQLFSVQKELEQMKRERYLISKGVAVDDVDYYAFKISKMMNDDDDFEMVAENYLKNNEKKQNTTTIVNFGVNGNQGNATLSLADEINRKLRGE